MVHVYRHLDRFSDVVLNFDKQEKQEEIVPLQIEFERMKETCKSQGRVIKRKMEEMAEMQEHMVRFLQTLHLYSNFPDGYCLFLPISSI